MPLYEYQCDSCAHRFEIIQKFSDPPADTCPTCGGPVKRLLSSPAIQFKGSGWYITDYARAGKSDGGAASSAANGSTDGAPAAPAAPAETKSDTTPAKSSTNAGGDA
ncbi:MAG: FmdB family zinc ribbon protein [Acidobacteriota bacterium]